MTRFESLLLGQALGSTGGYVYVLDVCNTFPVSGGETNAGVDWHFFPPLSPRCHVLRTTQTPETPSNHSPIYSLLMALSLDSPASPRSLFCFLARV